MAMVLPEQYNESNDMTTVSTLKHLDKYKDLIKWKVGECILEFSIGDGKCSANCLQPILPGDYKEFVVLDISKQKIDFVQSKINIPRVKFVVEDIANKELPSEFVNRFDHIFGIFAMHNVHDPNQAFKNIYKMLKPGGQVFVSCFDHKPVDEAFAKLAVHLKWKKYGDHTSAYYYKADPKSEYEKDLAEAGFKDYIFDVVTESHMFDENESIWKNLCISVNSAMATVSEEDMKEYTECYLNEVQNSKCLKRITPEDKSLTLTTKMFIIVATKHE